MGNRTTIQNYDMDRFERTLNHCDWTEFYCTTNPDALWQEMKATIEQTLDSMCPVKTYQVEDRQPNLIDSEIKQHIREKRRLLKIA